MGFGHIIYKYLNIADRSCYMTHVAQLDSKIMSLTVSIDGKELVAGTIGGKLYRVLVEDLSFLLHTDAHTGSINDIHFSPSRSD